MCGVTRAVAPTKAFGGTPYEATKRVRGVPKWVCGTHAGGSTGAFGGAPYGATKRVRGVHDGRRREEGRRRRGRKEGTRGTVSSKRGPNNTRWLGKTQWFANKTVQNICPRALAEPFKTVGFPTCLSNGLTRATRARTSNSVNYTRALARGIIPDR